MAQYLVVAHQTAASPSLIERLSAIAGDDSEVSFALLVPATHPMYLLAREGARFTWDERTAERLARARADEARIAFERAGLRVSRTIIGDASPILAIEDELRQPGRRYDAVVLSTLPPGLSRWIAMNVHLQAERLPVPVLHVYEGMSEDAGRRLLTQRPIGERLGRIGTPLGRLLAERQPSAFLIGGFMFAYLALATMLALQVHAQFLLNGVVALLVFAGLMIALVAMERGLIPARQRQRSDWMTRRRQS